MGLLNWFRMRLGQEIPEDDRVEPVRNVWPKMPPPDPEEARVPRIPPRGPKPQLAAEAPIPDPEE